MAHRALRAVVLQAAPLPMTKAGPLALLVQAKAPGPVLLVRALLRLVLVLLKVPLVQELALQRQSNPPGPKTGAPSWPARSLTSSWTASPNPRTCTPPGRRSRPACPAAS